MKKIGIFLCLLFQFLFAQGQDTWLLSGKVTDRETGEALPFATVGIAGTTIGTATNHDGQFALYIPAEHQNSQLICHYLGYLPEQLPLAGLEGKAVAISLAPAARELATVEVRPFSPEEYIRQAVAKIPENYGHTFAGKVYFRQVSFDNEQAVQFAEGYFQSYFPKFLDTTRLQQRLLLYQEKKDLAEVAFMKRSKDRKTAKAQRKAEKNGETFDAEQYAKKGSGFQMDLISPEILVDEDPVRKREPFLDAQHLDEFVYQFEDNTQYLGREMIVVAFRSKGKVAQAGSNLKGRQMGKIYLDKATDAIAVVEYESDMVIPAMLKPFLFAMGIGLSAPQIAKQVRYQYLDGKWFPQTVRFDLAMDLTKRYLFAENEHSHIDAEILMTITHVQTEKLSEIPKAVRFDPNKEMRDQVKPEPGIQWHQVNRIALEKP